MANPISESTQAFLESLDPTVREAAAAAVSRRAAQKGSIEFSLEEELNVAKAVKLVASADGLSRDERGALQFQMIMEAIPHELQRHVLDYDVSELELDHVSELFPPASRKAACVLLGATVVAAFDGLSPEELEQARELGAKLGLETKVVEALIAHAWAMGLAMNRGDRDLVDALRQLRQTLLGWV